MSTPVTALAASDMRMVRVMLAFDAIVAKLAGTMRPSTIAPWPLEAPRDARDQRRPGRRAWRVRVDRVAVSASDSASTLATPIGKPTSETP